MWESYLEKANSFFEWGRNKGDIELSALVEGKEEDESIILTDLLLPWKSKIKFYTNEEHRQYLKEPGSHKELEESFELLSCELSSCLTPSYKERIFSSQKPRKIKGLAHNHPAGEPREPSPGDLLSLIDMLRLLDREQEYLISIIYFGKEFETFSFPKQDVYFLKKIEKERGSYAALNKALGWFRKNREFINIHDYQIIKGK